jgi:hypothetical protein
MAGMSITVETMRRRAIVNIQEFWSKKLSVPVGEHPCFILGIWQGRDGDDWAGPVAVCELHNGHVFDCCVDQIRFVDTTEEGLIR